MYKGKKAPLSLIGVRKQRRRICMDYFSNSDRKMITRITRRATKQYLKLKR